MNLFGEGMFVCGIYKSIWGETMNERIQELCKQSGLKLDELPDDVYIPLEKFAELIVKDCVDIVNNQGPFLRYNMLTNAIQKHIGIKK